MIKNAPPWNIKKIISNGDYNYALVPEHPKATKNGYVFMHRIVVENHIGRLLRDNEVVHHIDRNKKNNNIENLQIMDNKEHSKHHALKQGKMFAKLKCPICKKKFEVARNQTFLRKPSKYGCTCCSHSCRGKLHRFIQLNGMTEQIKIAISENLLSVYKRYNNSCV